MEKKEQAEPGKTHGFPEIFPSNPLIIDSKVPLSSTAPWDPLRDSSAVWKPMTFAVIATRSHAFVSLVIKHGLLALVGIVVYTCLIICDVLICFAYVYV